MTTAHQLAALAEVTIGTSWECADAATVCWLALDRNLTGADVYQIGGGGYGGIAINGVNEEANLKGR